MAYNLFPTGTAARCRWSHVVVSIETKKVIGLMELTLKRVRRRET